MTDHGEALKAIEDSLDRPSAARVYDYFIGGETNYAIDRAFAEKLRERLPLIGEYCMTSREFLGRAVRKCSELGIRQFVDIGSGLPSVGNVHEVADDVRPELDTHVLYIDNEPIALAHSEVLLANTADPERHLAMAGDFLDRDILWNHIMDSGVINVKKPIALLINAVMHFIRDEQNPDELLEYYRKKLAPGSMLILSQMTGENPVNEDERQALLDLIAYYETTTNPATFRTMTEFSRFFGNWPLLEPGLVYAPAWYPTEHTLFASSPSESRVIGGVARKP
jgi:O-methyltransferase involved in polyketide biosynthesis